MNILGLLYHDSDYFHDSSAALFHDGNIAMYEEERFNKIKHSPYKFPKLSISHLLSDSNISIDDIDVIVIPNKVNEENVNEKLRKYFKSTKNFKFMHCDHHLSHFLNSYYQSNFKDCVGIIIDADGDNYKSISVFDVNDSKITCIKSFSTELSLGQLYQAASEYCGFGLFGEGKLMGLASFGNSLKKYFLNWNDNNSNIDILISDNTTKKHSAVVKSNCFNKKIIDYLYLKPILNIKLFLSNTFYPFKERTYKDEIIYYKDLAATIQDNYNIILLKLALYVKNITNKDNLILGGGCILNCVGNNMLINSQLFKEIYCSSIPHDGGISLGNVLFGINNMNIDINRRNICFSNSQYSIYDIHLSLKAKIKISDISISDIVDDIINGNIIGWFQNNAELGPRALGHRSIIANPSIRENLNTINYKIKHRDMFRPLAPIILDSEFNKVFNVNNYDLCNYMLRTLTINDKYRNKLCAVCHIDNTTRPQIISENDNDILYLLIKMFFNKSNIPGIINTSFNDKDVPIVETLDDAINMLLKTEKLDYIVFNGKIKIERI